MDSVVTLSVFSGWSMPVDWIDNKYIKYDFSKWWWAWLHVSHKFFYPIHRSGSFLARAVYPATLSYDSPIPALNMCFAWETSELYIWTVLKESVLQRIRLQYHAGLCHAIEPHKVQTFIAMGCLSRHFFYGDAITVLTFNLWILLSRWNIGSWGEWYVDNTVSS